MASYCLFERVIDRQPLDLRTLAARVNSAVAEIYYNWLGAYIEQQRGKRGSTSALCKRIDSIIGMSGGGSCTLRQPLMSMSNQGLEK
jgi:hypothetical protein